MDGVLMLLMKSIIILEKFREAVTEIKPDIYILGEIWHSSQAWLQGDEFHAVMNYAFTDSIKDYFAKRKSQLHKWSVE